jgi:hypothetical protein
MVNSLFLTEKLMIALIIKGWLVLLRFSSPIRPGRS